MGECSVSKRAGAIGLSERETLHNSTCLFVIVDLQHGGIIFLEEE
jgi:hypothetical protein